MKTVVADSQYYSRKLREQLSANGVKAVIPYSANQGKDESKPLWVDKHFRTHGQRLRGLFSARRQRSAIERTNSKLKDQLCLEKHRMRGLKRITIHALLCLIAMLLTAVAALRLNRPEKPEASQCLQDNLKLTRLNRFSNTLAR